MSLTLSFLLVALSSKAWCSIEEGSEQCINSAHCDSTSSDDDILSYLASIKRISIPSEAIRQDDGITFYPMMLSLADESVVQASRRYSEFDMLRQNLTLVPSDGKFPRKQIYDRACTWFKSLQSCVEDRRLGLEAYLNRALHLISQIGDEAQARILTTFMIKYSDDADNVAVVDTSYSPDTLKTSKGLLLNPGSALDVAEPVAMDNVIKDDLINEYYDTNMGIAFSMVSKMSWEWGGSWGLASDPESVPDGKIRYVSIVTHKQDMSVYAGKAFGLAFHITLESSFWKHFLVRKSGAKAGSIRGGPGDGGGGGGKPVLAESMGKDYNWFTKEKEAILAKYNTVYKIHDYNEFITMGTSKRALAGIFHYTKRRKYTPSDKQMCDILRHVRAGKWPIYAYDRKSLSIERYLNCD